MADSLEAPISSIISAAIPKNTPTIRTITELSDIHFNTLFQITLNPPALHASVTLKLSPPPNIRLLRCDKDLAAAEVFLLGFIQRSTTIPVPTIIGYDPTGDLIGSPYTLLSTLPGSTLSSYPSPLPSLDAIRAAGAHLHTLSTIKQHDHGFGRVGQGALVFETWRAAFLSLFDSLIMDAEEALVQLPYGAIRTQLRRWSAALDAVKKPRLGIIDFDARKVLVDGAEDGEAKLTGLIGFGRAVWGDPLIARWFRERETEEGKELLKGYFGGEREAEAEMWSWKTRVRLMLYDMYHCLYIILSRYYYGLGTESEMAERMRLVKCLEALVSFKTEDGVQKEFER